MAFAIGGAPARADVIYSTFGPGMSYANNIHPVYGPTSSNPKAFGVRFTAAATGNIASYDLALFPIDSGTLTIQILGSVGNAPTSPRSWIR